MSRDAQLEVASMHETADVVGAQLGALEPDGRPCFHRGGGIEVARTPQRWADLHRNFGLTRSELDPARILGGFAVPSDGIRTRLEVEYFGRRHPATVDPS